VAGRCVALTGQDAQAPVCSRTALAETLALAMNHITHRVTISQHHKLTRGSYMLVVTATAAGGLHSIPQSVRLAI